MPKILNVLRRNSPLAPWEVATDVADSAQPGLLPSHLGPRLSFLLSVALIIFLWPALGWAAIPTGMVFSRLLVMDLTTYTLPNIYTVPLICIGLCYALFHGQFGQAVMALCIMLSFSLTLGHYRVSMGLGGGDFKLLAALFAFLPLTTGFWAIAVGSLLWLPIACLKPKAMVPFGVPLILGWCLMLRFPHLPNWLISTIS